MGFFKEMLELVTDIGGLAVDAGKGCARKSRGWRVFGGSGNMAYETALAAFKQFGLDREKAVRFMNDDERRHYDRLAKEYPDGYQEYRQEMDEMLERDRQRQEKYMKEDPIGAFVEMVRNDENMIRADAEWDMAIDRDRGVYKPRSSYGL